MSTTPTPIVPTNSLIPIENVADWVGKDVLDPAGDKLGKLDGLFYDSEADVPSFVAVRSGLVGKHLSLVPLMGASAGPDHLRVAHDKKAVKDAPNFETDTELAQEDEAEVFAYYGLSYTPTVQGGRRLARR
jgi:hypothetical protein